MATQHISSAPCAPAPSRPYRQATTGYGKRSVPDQAPPQAADFARLPERERYVARYVDHLPDGAAMDIKSLAKDLPLYGQMAIGTALRTLAVAGHLRHVRCRVETLGQNRWVTRTYWSRTARDHTWWTTHLATVDSPSAAATAPLAALPPAAGGSPTTDTPEPSPSAVAPAAPAVPSQRTPEAAPADRSSPSPAYTALARLGRVEPRLALSAADCTALEGLAERWFTRGVDADHLIRTLASGLPPEVGSPIGLVRRRLLDKLPPALPRTPAPHAGPGTPPRRVLVECAECGRPGPPEALPDGLCRPCRAPAATTDPAAASEASPGKRDLTAYLDTLRDEHALPA
ncbi:MarR family transcriptional regulator [Streptomyces sp. SM5]|uniref:MarR family transcriptional regulator n=1 Tax=Streptomyces sp. SM5 TaxID=402233 RepID=UPI000CD5BEC5|nr:MarR family transcriptional regulator [Streptomyces sp. SM5]